MLKFEAKKGDFPKIWQKQGGLQPPSPGSAAHDELKNAFYTSTNKFYSHLKSNEKLSRFLAEVDKT